MGGFGSGSYYRFGSRDRVEDCLGLDVRSWWRLGPSGSKCCLRTLFTRLPRAVILGNL